MFFISVSGEINSSLHDRKKGKPQIIRATGAWDFVFQYYFFFILLLQEVTHSAAHPHNLKYSFFGLAFLGIVFQMNV